MDGAAAWQSGKVQTERENSSKKPIMTSLFPHLTCWLAAIYLFFISVFATIGDL